MQVGRILVVDRELIVQKLLTRIFSQICEVIPAGNENEARKLIEKYAFDMAFIGNLSEPESIEIVHDIKQTQSDIKIVIMAGFSVDDPVPPVIEHHVTAVLHEPFTPYEVSTLYNTLSKQKNLSNF